MLQFNGKYVYWSKSWGYLIADKRTAQYFWMQQEQDK